MSLNMQYVGRVSLHALYLRRRLHALCVTRHFECAVRVTRLLTCTLCVIRPVSCVVCHTSLNMSWMSFYMRYVCRTTFYTHFVCWYFNTRCIYHESLTLHHVCQTYLTMCHVYESLWMCSTMTSLILRCVCLTFQRRGRLTKVEVNIAVLAVYLLGMHKDHHDTTGGSSHLRIVGHNHNRFCNRVLSMIKYLFSWRLVFL